MGGLQTTASSGINTNFWFSCKIINQINKTETSFRRVERLERKLWYGIQNVTGSIPELCLILLSFPACNG